MGKFSVPCIVDAPTASNLLLVEQTPGIIGGNRLAPGFELIDLAAGAGLMPINAAGLQEPRAADLLALGIQNDCCNQCVDAPVEPDEAFPPCSSQEMVLWVPGR